MCACTQNKIINSFLFFFSFHLFFAFSSVLLYFEYSKEGRGMATINLSNVDDGVSNFIKLHLLCFMKIKYRP